MLRELQRIFKDVVGREDIELTLNENESSPLNEYNLLKSFLTIK